MKIVFVYILLLSFALRPAYNIGYVAYFELNIDYIIETYCINKEKVEMQCNGKCHLAKQLSVTKTETEDSTLLFASFFDAFFPVYFQDYKQNYQLKAPSTSILHSWMYNNQFVSIFKDCLNPPPQI